MNGPNRSHRRELLSKLLQAHENSVSYRRPAPWPREVILRIDSRTYPEAFAPDGREERGSLIAAAQKLQQEGCLRIAQHGKGPLIGEPKELRLGPENVDHAYKAAEQLGFEPLHVGLQAIERQATELRSRTNLPWMRSFLDELAVGAGNANLGVIGMQRDRFKREWRDLSLALKASVVLANGIAPAWERVVSERLFDDSKLFGRIRSQVVLVLIRADPRWEGIPFEEASDLLEAYGVRRKPGLIRCAGVATLNVGSRTYRLEDFLPVAHLPDAWGEAWVESVLKSEVRVITTVENEYPFFSYVEEAGGSAGLGKRGELVVYTAGFPTPALISTLARVSERAPSALFRHWGDADVGGIRIWWFLRRRLGRCVDFFRTTPGWVASESGHGGRSLSSIERSALSRLRRELESTDDADVATARELIDALLLHGRKLEQERF